MERVQAHADVKAILTTCLHHVLVGTDTGSLKSYTKSGIKWMVSNKLKKMVYIVK